jgi:hypothetical protein
VILHRNIRHRGIGSQTHCEPSHPWRRNTKIVEEPNFAQEMKGALQRTVQRAVSNRHDPQQITRRLSSVSSSDYNDHTHVPLRTFPLAETGWEHPLQTTRSSDDDSLSEYNCSVEDALSRLLEIHQLGKCDSSFQNLQLAVTAARHSKSLHACYLCGRTKFLNELCDHCALIPATAQK